MRVPGSAELDQARARWPVSERASQGGEKSVHVSGPTGERTGCDVAELAFEQSVRRVVQAGLDRGDVVDELKRWLAPRESRTKVGDLPAHGIQVVLQRGVRVGRGAARGQRGRLRSQPVGDSKHLILRLNDPAEELQGALTPDQRRGIGC